MNSQYMDDSGPFEARYLASLRRSPRFLRACTATAPA